MPGPITSVEDYGFSTPNCVVGVRNAKLNHGKFLIIDVVYCAGWMDWMFILIGYEQHNHEQHDNNNFNIYHHDGHDDNHHRHDHDCRSA